MEIHGEGGKELCENSGVREEALYTYIFLKIYYLFIYFWLCWVLVAARGSLLRHAGSFVAVRGLLHVGSS